MPTERRVTTQITAQAKFGSRKLLKMVGSWGLEPQTSTVSIPRPQTHCRAPRSTESHLRISLDRRSDPHSAHRAAPGRVCALVQGSPGYDTKYVTIFCACRTVFRFFESRLHR